jgi:hypothetical protein
MQDDKTIRTMRNMAWERAKGELRAMAQTYWKEDSKYQKIMHIFDAFVEEVENNGYQE